MKHSVTLALLLLLSQSVSFAGVTKKTLAKGSGTKLETSFKFEGSSLRGKYQTSLNTTATVENDKYMNDLLEGRKEFKDRQKKDATRE